MSLVKFLQVHIEGKQQEDIDRGIINYFYFHLNQIYALNVHNRSTIDDLYFSCLAKNKKKQKQKKQNKKTLLFPGQQ